MSAAATKAPKMRERLTLRDVTDLLLLVGDYVETHVDELELNGGALPDDLAQLLDEIEAATADRVDAIAAKIDEFVGYATTAKATEDRAARRRRVWENATKALKAYALRQVERHGGTPLKGAAATLRLQRNGAPSVEVRFTDEQLLDLASVETHPLARFLTVQRVAKLDSRALGAAYEARRAELEGEAELIGESDVAGLADDVNAAEGAVSSGELERRVSEARDLYVADHLAAEFPGVACVRGHHLRID